MNLLKDDTVEPGNEYKALFFPPDKKIMGMFREVVQTTVLKHDLPNHKTDGGL